VVTSRLCLTALFDDGDAIQTSINASRREAAEYYLCNTFTSQDEKPSCRTVLILNAVLNNNTRGG
jgi:hypothetical protein